MDLLDKMVDAMTRDLQSKADAAFFNPSEELKSSADGLREFLDLRTCPPARREALVFASGVASLMRESGFCPSNGDVCFIPAEQLFPESPNVVAELPDWIRPALFLDKDAVYFLKAGYEGEFIVAATNEFLKPRQGAGEVV